MNEIDTQASSHTYFQKLWTVTKKRCTDIYSRQWNSFETSSLINSKAENCVFTDAHCLFYDQTFNF